jgi:hypothetical protein
VIYEVDWLQTALQELEKIWSRSDESSRIIIRDALARVMDRLSIAPYGQGESRQPNAPRLLFELPLRIRYRIERFQGAVTVLQVQLVRKRQR